MARNWMRTLLPASFRGVPFYVESDDADGHARRVAVHEISGGENHLTEDMGAMVPMAYVTAYVTGDLADGKAQILQAACRAPGASLLTMPIDMPRQVHCTACRRNRTRDQGGYIAFDLEFVVAGGAGGGIMSGLGQLRDAFTGAIKNVASALSR